ncbi:MAG: tRNA (adenosine(37)-N6)-threonylcarbamoyltransferase complex ATPase subunit type 1 TsaE [Bacteroidetes bacterium]|nr:tRNA (adenosine(37)-N6)-threonylcarbamoyltransferase complex ATPase subunit type 1 TsaE [Bacteroidota bacterium]
MQSIKKTFHAVKESKLSEVSSYILENYNEDRIFAISGEMGAGKTTLVKDLCRTLGVEINMSSPTFALVNEYYYFPENSAENTPVYHLDFYRISNIKEALDAGFEHYIYSGNYCFIEWPEKVESLLEDIAIRIKIEESGNQERNITIYN